MNTIECIKTRRSIRKYTDQPVSKEDICRIVEAASFSPSWKNSQVVRYTVVLNRDKIQEMANESTMGFAQNTHIMEGCSAVVVQSVVTGICGFQPDGSYTTNKGDGWQMFDAGISAQTFCLAAHEYGIGTVILGLIDSEKLAAQLNLPEDQMVTSVIAMGYAESPRQAPPRKSVAELLTIVE